MFNMLCNFSLIPIISSRNRFIALHTEIFNVPQWYLIFAMNSLTSSNSLSMSMSFFATCINEWLNSQHIIVTQTQLYCSPLMFSIRYPFSLICLFDMRRPKSSHAYTALFLRKNYFKIHEFFLIFPAESPAHLIASDVHSSETVSEFKYDCESGSMAKRMKSKKVWEKNKK